MTTFLLECPKCGWCHFGVTEEYVQKWEKDWVVHWDKLDEKGRESYGCSEAPPTREEYLRCFRCGNPEVENFFQSKKSLNGHTIQPVLLTPQQEKEWLLDQ